MEMFWRYAAIIVASVLLVGNVHAQPAGTGSPVPPQTMVALQAAIAAKDVTAIANILSATPRDQRGPLATLLLSSAQSVQSADAQFAASLAALAFMSGGLTNAQQNTALAVIRSAPGGLALVSTVLSNNLTGGFGLSPAATTGFFNLIITENQNQTQSSPN